MRLSLQSAVSAITKRHVPRPLAGAPRNRFGFGDFHFLGFETGALVRAIAERLALGEPAGAPPISAGLNLLNDG